MKDRNEILRDLYYNLRSPVGYGNARDLYKAAIKKDPNITQKIVNKWLSNQDVYSINRRKLRKFKRRKYITKGMDYLHQMDLLDVSRLAPYNSNYRYLLTIICCFSRFAFVRPLKRKLPSHVAAAIDDVYKQNKNRIPRNAQTDLGGEFLGPDTKAIFKKYTIHWYSVPGVIKGAFIERFNRSFRNIMSKPLFGQSRPRYLDILQQLVDQYNSRQHRIIGMAPKDVNKNNERELWYKLYNDVVSHRAVFKYKTGDVVKIIRKKGLFEKEAAPTWSVENYNIVYRRATNPPTYKIYNPRIQSILKGSYYEQELQKIWSKN